MEENSTPTIVMVDINEILPNRFQPRIEFDEEEILGLSSSIKEHGIIKNTVLRISDVFFTYKALKCCLCACKNSNYNCENKLKPRLC